MQDAHAQAVQAVLEAMGVAGDTGLDQAEAARRRRRYGPNRLQASRRRSVWSMVLAQFNSIIVYLLAAGALVSLAFGDWAEGGAILVVLLINSVIGFTSEYRATRSMEALKRLSKVKARVRRGGAVSMIPAEEMVPGDVVLLESGDVVPADVRLIDSASLQCDESMLTGESVPVAKATGPVAADASLAQRADMAFKGTAITRGSGEAVAVATGMQTQLGRIAALAESAEGEASPLEKRLDRLGGQLVWATLALTGAIAATGVYAGSGLATMLETAIALAVAAVPEGLPIVATVALARGMWRMARRNALIKDLSAVETLGATTVILTDKTGTLTENRMSAVRLRVADADIDLTQAGGDADPGGGQAQPLALTALRIAVLCNNASLAGEAGAGRGDPMEVALLAAGKAYGLERARLLADAPQVREEAFSADTKMMATFQRADDGFCVAVKGAPEAVLEHCTHVLKPNGEAALDTRAREAWTRANEDMTAQGLRVLAVATKKAADEHDEPYAGITLVGLLGLLDPPRRDVAAAIAACRSAGVRVVMVTGDHAGTARTIAAQVGLGDDATVADAGALADESGMDEQARRRLLEATIFARVDPETKLRLVSWYQRNGAVVAMTGDGVNDAPALKKADIGIAMGQRGTEVAREAADMVLRDDAFPSIVAAMRQGRVIFANIRKFVCYLMSCNLSEILVIGVATLMGLPLPLLPLQILYLNLVTDVFPAFALGVGEGDPQVMRRPPRKPQEAILDRRRWLGLGGYAVLITAATLGSFLVALRWLAMTVPGAVTISFLTLACAQLWHVFNMRDADSGLWRNDITANPFVWGALALCAGLILAGVYAPGLSPMLGMKPPGTAGWSLVAIASVMPLLVGQAVKSATAWRRRRTAVR